MRTALVICPGRGTYNATELGYLGRAGLDPDLLGAFDTMRREAGQVTLRDLDGAERYSASTHATGDNASALIFACTLADVLALRDIDIVAVTGNSMGWYSALACGGALAPLDGFRLVNTMGRLMHEHATGGQLVYPWMSDDWHRDMNRKAGLVALAREIGEREGHALTLSIDLGGMLVLAGDEPGLAAFEAAVPRIGDRFPMRLRHHAAFHSPLMAPISEIAAEANRDAPWRQPSIPLIDGRGHVWWPGASDLEALRDYTLGHQITEPYDFTAAIRTAAREFAPELFIVPGPGTTLGGAVAQSLICADWRVMRCKSDFEAVQSRSALLVAMGRDDQKSDVT